MDDRRDRVEKGERILAGPRRDPVGKRAGGQRPGGDDDAGPIRRRGGDEFATHLDARLGVDRRCNAGGEIVAVDRQCRPGRHPRGIGAGQDQRPQRPHLGVDQPDRIVLGVVGAEAVRADQFGQCIGVWCASVLCGPRISWRTTGTPARAACHAASDPARPPPMMWIVMRRTRRYAQGHGNIVDLADSLTLTPSWSERGKQPRRDEGQ